MNSKKPIYVTFGEKKIEREFEILKKGKFQDKQLYEFISRAINDIKLNPPCGIKIPKRLWPKTYIDKYNLANLWKYGLANRWGVVLTI